MLHIQCFPKSAFMSERLRVFCHDRKRKRRQTMKQARSVFTLKYSYILILSHFAAKSFSREQWNRVTEEILWRRKDKKGILRDRQTYRHFVIMSTMHARHNRLRDNKHLYGLNFMEPNYRCHALIINLIPTLCKNSTRNFCM